MRLSRLGIWMKIKEICKYKFRDVWCFYDSLVGINIDSCLNKNPQRCVSTNCPIMGEIEKEESEQQIEERIKKLELDEGE